MPALPPAGTAFAGVEEFRAWAMSLSAAKAGVEEFKALKPGTSATAGVEEFRALKVGPSAQVGVEEWVYNSVFIALRLAGVTNYAAIMAGLLPGSSG